MKKVLLILIVAGMIIAMNSCEKDDDVTSLIGSEWSGYVEDFYDWGVGETVTAKFLSETKVNTSLSDGYSYTGDYSYNYDTKKGFMQDDEGSVITFSISGDNLNADADGYKFTLKRKK